MALYRLGSICQIISGSTPKTGVQEYWNGDKKWITPAELSESDYIVYDTERRITDAGVKSAGLTPLPKGTVILSSRAPIGKVAIAGCEMYCNQGFKNLVCTDVINNRYLYWYLKSKTDYLNSLGRGATFKEISKSIVSDIELNVPELSTQVERVAHLEKLQSIISHRRAQLAKLDELVKCRFVELFGNIQNNRFNYPIYAVRELTQVWTGATPNRNNTSYYRGNIPWVKTGEIEQGYIFDTEEHITENAIKETNCKILPQYSVLIAMYGQGKTRGKAGILYIKAATNQACAAILPSLRLNPLFTYYYFLNQYEELRGLGHGAQQTNINLEIVKNYRIMVPPIEEQNTFASFVSRIDKLRFVDHVGGEQSKQSLSP